MNRKVWFNGTQMRMEEIIEMIGREVGAKPEDVQRAMSNFDAAISEEIIRKTRSSRVPSEAPSKVSSKAPSRVSSMHGRHELQDGNVNFSNELADDPKLHSVPEKIFETKSTQTEPMESPAETVAPPMEAQATPLTAPVDTQSTPTEAKRLQSQRVESRDAVRNAVKAIEASRNLPPNRINPQRKDKMEVEDVRRGEPDVRKKRRNSLTLRINVRRKVRGEICDVFDPYASDPRPIIVDASGSRPPTSPTEISIH